MKELYDVGVEKLPEFKSAPVKHNHAAHLARSKKYGRTIFVLTCPECQSESQGRYGVPVNAWPLNTFGEKPRCPACLGENE